MVGESNPQADIAADQPHSKRRPHQFGYHPHVVFAEGRPMRLPTTPKVVTDQPQRLQWTSRDSNPELHDAVVP